ncbi:hypothetical protein HPA92_09350 [Streptococcus suis]|nr:hypothetical protein [Streptococcus suis]HEM6282821.1 hypothetical protein [Streptococcus suis]
MEVMKCIQLEKEFAGRRGWAKRLLRVRVNISAQWLIGLNSHYSDCWSYAGVGGRTLFLLFIKSIKVFDEKYFEFNSQNKEIVLFWTKF